MRIISLFFMGFLLISCFSSKKISSFEFYDSGGNPYQLFSAGEKIKQEYNLLKKPKIVLVATKERQSSELKKQLSAIYQVDAEELGFILILTNAEQPDKSGYYTDKMTAKDILNQDSFRIVIINEAARPIASSNTPISSEDLKNYLTKSSSGR